MIIPCTRILSAVINEKSFTAIAVLSNFGIIITGDDQGEEDSNSNNNIFLLFSICYQHLNLIFFA